MIVVPFIIQSAITALLQFLAALFVGVCWYMLAMAMTVFDGILSLILQPFVAVVMTSVAIVPLWILGLPIRLCRGLRAWWLDHWWISPVLGAVAFAMMCASWYPDLRIKVWNPEFEYWQESFQPHLSVGGWLLTLFAVLHFFPPFQWLHTTPREKQ